MIAALAATEFTVELDTDFVRSETMLKLWF